MMMLRIQKKEVSEDTKQAVKTFSNLMAALAIRYKQYENGELDLEL